MHFILFFRRSIKTAFVSFLFFAPLFAGAASLWLSPSTGTYLIGEEFSVSVRISSEGELINAAEGLIVFNPDIIEITKTSFSESVFNSWTTEPEFSNETGAVSFAGLSGRGFEGEDGKVFEITLKAKRPEQGSLNFSSAAVLASDGTGSNILEEMRGGAYTFVPRTLSPEPESFMSQEGAPPAPNVFSFTHPDELSWYSDNAPIISWEMPSGINAVRIILGNDPNLTPSVQYSSPINQRSLADLNLNDGTWYFRVQFRNSFGWGEIATFRINIDTEPPEKFNMTRVGGEDPTDPIVELVMDALDKTSGIDYYEIRINDLEPIVWQDPEGGIGPLPPGEKFIVVKAVDMAGNYLLASEELEIIPLEPPSITHYPSRLPRGELLFVQGFTQPSNDVVFWLQKGSGTPESYKIKTKEDGSFTFINENKMDDGVYTMWAESIDERGAKSLPEGDFRIIVSPPRILVMGSFVIDSLTVVIPLVAVAFLLFSVVIYGYGKAKALRKKVGEDIKIAEGDLHRVFIDLKNDVKKQIDLIEEASKGKEFREKEHRAVINLKKSLIKAERRISRDISDIKKDLG